MSKLSAEQRSAVNELWNRGVLTYKLHDAQKIIKETIEQDIRDIIPVLCSRRFGKSFYFTLLSVETCIKNPGCIVKYICPKLKQVKTIIQPIMREILKDCPETLKPQWKENDKIFIFPNGSEIQLAGTDNNNAENLRGGSSILCIVDEAGFCDDLKYVIGDILAPTTDTTDGKIILSSTPSRDSGHEFIQEYVKPAQAANNLIKFTIYDNPMITENKLQRIIARHALGVEDPTFRREYLCEILNDSEDLVIPEWTDKLQARCVKEWPRPSHYDVYVSCDVGFRDLTVVLWGYYDFLDNKLVIEDELVMNGPSMTTEALAQKIQEKEAELYADPITKEPQAPYLRIMDNNLILINDLHRLHGLTFIPTKKDDKEAAINKTRMMLAGEQIIINPKCKTLLYHLGGASWDKNKKSFKRMSNINNNETLGGHADALDALIYMVRNYVPSKNPFPPGMQYGGTNTFSSRLAQSEHPLAGMVKKIMNINNLTRRS